MKETGQCRKARHGARLRASASQPPTASNGTYTMFRDAFKRLEQSGRLTAVKFGNTYNRRNAK